MPVKAASGITDIKYDFKKLPSVDQLTGIIECFTTGETNLHELAASVLSLLNKHTPKILADLANKYIKTGIFKTLASLVATHVVSYILSWLTSRY